MDGKISVINLVIDIPSMFNQKTFSSYSLLKESGYFELHQEITEEDIWNELLNKSDCIDDWLQWSEDKRVSSGWYFICKDENATVGYYPDNVFDQLYYSDNYKACAAFIKREVEAIRTNH